MPRNGVYLEPGVIHTPTDSSTDGVSFKFHLDRKSQVTNKRTDATKLKINSKFTLNRT